MLVTHLEIKNWRNFRDVKVKLGERAFLVGPNACGKSNLLDVFRFLRDIVTPGGGLQKAVADRGGISKIRCLAARHDPAVYIGVCLAESVDADPAWRYEIEIKQESRGKRRLKITKETVFKGQRKILDRPESLDKADLERLTQTHLEQVNSNKEFRPISEFFQDVLYLHLVPQLVRNPEAFAGPGIPYGDPFGRNFIDRIVNTPKKTRDARLRKIEKALQNAVPQLKGLTDARDESGVPHLEVTYEHWRPHAGKQREDQFSDGTLRLVGLLWALLEGNNLLLMEEPELSLNTAIVKKLPGLMYHVRGRNKRQTILSTHSFDLLSDKGISPDEVFLLIPGKEGTEVRPASSDIEIMSLLAEKLSIADAIQPKIEPRQLDLFSIPNV